MKEKNDKGLYEMYVEIYNKYFAGHAVFNFMNPNKKNVYIVKGNMKKHLWKFEDNGVYAYIMFNNLLTDEEIKKGMVNIIASGSVGVTRKNDSQKMEHIARVAAEIGTTKDDIMSVYKIRLSERK